MRVVSCIVTNDEDDGTSATCKGVPEFSQSEIPFCMQTFEIFFLIDEELLKHNQYTNKENDIQRIITHTTKKPLERDQIML